MYSRQIDYSINRRDLMKHGWIKIAEIPSVISMYSNHPIEIWAREDIRLIWIPAHQKAVFQYQADEKLTNYFPDERFPNVGS
jgi:predicted ATP-grasp superfamily ATP-dependent carboligase